MKRIITLLLILIPFITVADDKYPHMKQLMKSFVECDADFFSTVANYKNELSAYSPVVHVNAFQAYIPVKDRNKNGSNYYKFIKPIVYNSLSITGYYDSALTLDKYGDYYFWGFTIDNSLQDIQNEFSFLAWFEMEKGSLYTTNNKIHYLGDSLEKWHDNPSSVTGVKTMPSPGSTEKLLLLEKGPDMTLLVCSMQGFFPPELLATIRPDIKR